MKKKNIYLRTGVLVLLILLAAFSRLIPHMPNFAPMGAMALFGAAYFTKKWQAFLIPIVGTWISDLYINNVIYSEYFPQFTWFYGGFYWQYGCYLLVALAGLAILKKVTPVRLLIAALLSTAIFFLVSNFGVWIGSNMYPHTASGLMTCYATALPFLKGTLAGDLTYCIGLFGAFTLSQWQFPVLLFQKETVR